MCTGGSHSCPDESFCNGYSYGVWCKSGSYLPPYLICSAIDQCLEKSIDIDCSINENSTTCFNLHSGMREPLYNFSRCAARYTASRIRTGLEPLNFCENFFDQTNCSDPLRVGVICPVNSFMSSIAKQIICNSGSGFYRGEAPKIPQICDDGLDKACVQISLSCFLHKHFMCNGEANCEDLSDELHEQCDQMTTKTFYRRFIGATVKDKIPFPLKWVGDGVNDCLDGEDEIDNWPTCGHGATARYVRYDSSCREVFLCYNIDQQFIEFADLCDRKESCHNENKICFLSRQTITPVTTALRDEKGRLRLFYCLKGLKDVEYLKKSTCSLAIHLKSNKIFGYNTQNYEFMVPDAMIDCRHVYGEHYVFLSCFGRCSNNPICPLTRQILWNSCPGQFQNKRVFTQVTNGELTFLLRDHKTGELGRDLFRCENNRCLTYDKICNLVDDCGDSSDESPCSNHYQCETSREYLPITQQCDGIINCADMSDECNDTCGQRLIGSYFIRIAAWVVGILAIVLNGMSLFNNISTISKCKSEPALLNNGLIALISLGDFVIGLYITVIIAHDAYYGTKYCLTHLEWISSDTCVALGAISTTASHISLFSMTFLSLLRLSGVKNDFMIPKSVTNASFEKLAGMVVTILTVSLVISLTPLVKGLEDFFVNGIRFEASNTLFHGCPNKKILLSILHEYYGRMMVDDLTWVQIETLVKPMFSYDYGGISYKRQSFYGNDAVCSFKYFVRKDEPQGMFVFVLLSFNFMCFVVIGLSYGAVVATTRKSTKRVAMNNTDKTAKKITAKLHRITIWIIFTDFVCWVPFIAVCCFHYLEIFDATEWYSFFSLLVLPINSVINPIIYDRSMETLIYSIYSKIRTGMMNLVSLIELRRLNGVQDNANAVVDPGIELKEMVHIVNQMAIGTAPEPQPDFKNHGEQ